MQCLWGATFVSTRCRSLFTSRLALTRWQCITPELPIMHTHPFNRLALTEVLGSRTVRRRLLQGKATSMQRLSPNSFPGPLRWVWTPKALAPKLMPGERQLSRVGQARSLLPFRSISIRWGTSLFRRTSTESYRPLVIPKQAHKRLLPQTAVNAMGRMSLFIQFLVLIRPWSMALLKGVWMA